MVPRARTGSKKKVDKKVDNSGDIGESKTTTQLIYEMAIGQHESAGGLPRNGSDIAGILGKSRQYVSKILTKLIKQGYITCDNPRDKVKFYSPTKKSPKIDKKRLTKNAKNATGSNPVMPTEFTGGSLGSVFSTSKSQWSCPVTHFNESNLVGWKKMRLANNVFKFTKGYLFSEPFPTVLHFQVVGKRNFTMTLTFPPVEFKNKDDFLGAKEYIQDYAVSAMKFISRKYHMVMDLRLLRLSSCDFEARLKDADIKNFIDTAQVIIKYHKGNIYMGKISFDGSGGVDRIESDVPKWITDYVELPSFSQRLNELEKRIPEIIDRNMDKIERGIGQRLDDMFNVAKKPDEKRDVT